MNDEPLYRDWIRARAEQPAPPGFADRVMAAAQDEDARRRRSFAAALMLSLLSSRAGRVAACTVAASCCLFRLMHVIAIFVAR